MSKTSIKKMQKKSTTRKKASAKKSARKAPFNIEKNLDQADVKFKKLITKIKKSCDEINLEAHLGLLDLEDQLQRAKKWLDSKNQAAQSVRAKARAGVDTAQVKMHLAKMDTETSIQAGFERLQALRREIKDLENHVSDDVRKILQDLKRTGNSIYEKLTQ